MTLPTQREIEPYLLLEISNMGGQVVDAKQRLVLAEKIRAHFPQITEDELKETISTGAPRWVNRIGWTRSDLVKKGELDPTAPAGVWHITETGLQRLKREGLLVQPPPPPPPPVPSNDLDQLAHQIKALLDKLVALAKQEKPEPKPSHEKLVQLVREMGQMLGKNCDPVASALYKHDCVWKNSPWVTPSLVWEVCDKGVLDKDIASLQWALTAWKARGVLVIVEESDFDSARRKLALQKEILPIRAQDMLGLYELMKAGDIDTIRTIFGA